MKIYMFFYDCFSPPSSNILSLYKYKLTWELVKNPAPKTLTGRTQGWTRQMTSMYFVASKKINPYIPTLI